VIDSLGVAGIAVMMATSGIVGLPGTEPTMLFAGFDVYRGHQTMLGIVVCGALGDVIGASVAYAIGHWGGRELIERHGSKVHLSPERFDRAHRWSERYGPLAVLVSRLIPGGRLVFPYAAGLAEMSYLKFIAFAGLGSIAWAAGLGFLGRQVGSDWKSWRNHLEYVDYVVLALIVIAAGWLILRRVRAGRRAAVDAVPD
jgi:membrane protein DedA with SNARE-associated domain